MNVTVIYIERQNGTKTLDELNAEEAQVYLPAAIFVSILSVIGVTSNVHILAVFWYRMERSSTRIFILSLAVLDLLTSVLGMPFIAATSLLPYKFTNAAACKGLSLVSYFTTTASGLILVMIAVDRYRQVCRPMGRQMSRTVVTGSCLGSMCVAVALTWPTVIFYNVNEKDTGYNNVTGMECSFDTGLRNGTYIRIFHYVLLSVSLLSFIILVLLYGCIRHTIVKHEAYLAKFIIHKPRKTNMKKNISPSIDTLNESLFDTTCSQDDVIFTRSDKPHNNDDVTKSLNESVDLNETTLDEIPLRRMNTIKEEPNEENNEIQNDCKEIGSTVHINDVSVTTQDSTVNLNGDSQQHAQQRTPEMATRERHSFDSVLTVDTERPGRNYRSESSVRAFLRQKKSTVMFILITVVFLCGYVFHELLILTVTLSPDIYKSMSRTEKSLYFTALWFVFINNVCNSAIYGYFHRRFRDELIQFYKGLVCRR